MRPEAFRRAAEARWSQTEGLIRSLERGRRTNSQDFPRLYRRLCHDLAIARDRHFDAPLVDRLNQLAIRGGQHLYRFAPLSADGIRRFLLVDFPQAVRRNAVPVVIAIGLFLGTMLGIGVAVQFFPSLVYSIVPFETIESIEGVYDPEAANFMNPVDSSSRVHMFGFYIMNNVGIAFRVFAGGILFGIGSILMLIYNGLYLGAVGGHLVRVGFGTSFFSFVAGHSALELFGATLAGVAGLRTGWSLVTPGQRSRGVALRETSREMSGLITGSAVMLVTAAVIEAFWSPQPIPPIVRQVVGVVMAVLVAAYFLFAGRERGLQEDRTGRS